MDRQKCRNLLYLSIATPSSPALLPRKDGGEGSKSGYVSHFDVSLDAVSENRVVTPSWAQHKKPWLH